MKQRYTLIWTGDYAQNIRQYHNLKIWLGDVLGEDPYELLEWENTGYYLPKYINIDEETAIALKLK